MLDGMQPLINLETLSSCSEYKYDALPAEGWTRILVLDPGIGSLSCSLISENIVDLTLEFEALSYVWGSDALEKKFSIECDGCVLSIGPNLASALTHIRHETEPRLLWVDAICINQKDTDERSLQVQYMGDIYASAKRVLVWMGEDSNDEAEECFDLIANTNAYLMGKLLQYQSVDDIPPISYQDRYIDADTKKWDMVRRLMDSEWFNRVWVLQEIGLARSAMIYYGKATMEWSHLVEFMLFVASRADVGTRVGNVKSGTIWDIFEDIWCSFGNKITWRDELPLTRSLNKVGCVRSLVNILNVTRPYKATNQRDRVYAFLSHPSAARATQKAGRMILPNYKKSLDGVYLDTAIRILETDGNPWALLSSVDHKPDSISLSGQRPSWVPRWEEGWFTYWLGYPEMWYRAGGNMPAPFNAKASETDATLRIQGIILDTITWISRAFEDDELRVEHQVRGAPVQELWQQLEQQDLSALYGESCKDRDYAFSLTVAAGRATDDGPAEENPALHRSIYQEYKDLLNWCTYSSSIPTAKRAEIQRHVFETTAQMNARTYIANQRRALHNRRFFLTSKGYYGIGHRSLESRDVCAVFRGANVPFILRKVPPHERTGDAPNRYRLIGESYIQGIMRGEIFDGRNHGSHDQRGILVEETITII